MSTDKPMGTNPQRFEAALRISEVIAACREPEELARALANRLDEFLNFDRLYLAVLKENSREIESFVLGKDPTGWPTTLPVEPGPILGSSGYQAYIPFNHLSRRWTGQLIISRRLRD
jgi:hypothetical protein